MWRVGSEICGGWAVAKYAEGRLLLFVSLFFVSLCDGWDVECCGERAVALCLCLVGGAVSGLCLFVFFVVDGLCCFCVVGGLCVFVWWVGWAI